jgi:Ca2+-binding EF-hand superfamily protein
MNPIFAALDTNGDGVVDEKELANATVALKKLDKNGDGKITEDEVRPAGFRGRGGPNGANPEEMVTRLMQFDKNADGKLSKDELPERMQNLLERGDTDKDGFLSKAEIRKLAETSSGQAPRGGGPGPGPGDGPDRGSRETR